MSMERAVYARQMRLTREPPSFSRGLCGVIFTAFTLACVGAWVARTPALAQTASPADAAPREKSQQEKEELEREKLKEEIRKLRLENERSSRSTAVISEIAPTATALVAVIGALLAVFRYLREQERIRNQRQAESRQRLDERFATISTDLGSESTASRVGAAVALLTFLTDEHTAFHEQVFYLLVENLKLKEQNLEVKRILVRGLEVAFRAKWIPVADPAQLDLARAYLRRIDLSGQDFAGGDFAFADLRHADLSSCNLFRLRGYGVQFKKASLSGADLREARLNRAECEGAHFHRSNLISAHLKEANLEYAEFHQAQLQSAHFESAKLNGASFPEADLNDSYFVAAELDGGTLRSIVRAKNWRKAHFDESVLKQLEELAGTQPASPSNASEG